MKLLLALTIAICSINAFAQTPNEQASLDRFNTDANLPIFSPNAGSIAIDSIKHEVDLTLVHKTVCLRPMVACPMYVLAPYVANLPITNSTTDNCGIPHIIAQQDSRSTGGDLEVIEVLDNAKSHCGNVTIPSEVIYETTNAQGVQTRSTFDGTALIAN
jgi:hypothetical protein